MSYVNKDNIQLDDNDYFYIDQLVSYEYQHKYIDGQEEIKSDWQELNAYNYSRKFKVGISQTYKRRK